MLHKRSKSQQTHKITASFWNHTAKTNQSQPVFAFRQQKPINHRQFLQSDSKNQSITDSFCNQTAKTHTITDSFWNHSFAPGPWEQATARLSSHASSTRS
jgi:hypothetical protein